jgi:hypothetical protein
LKETNLTYEATIELESLEDPPKGLDVNSVFIELQHQIEGYFGYCISNYKAYCLQCQEEVSDALSHQSMHPMVLMNGTSDQQPEKCVPFNVWFPYINSDKAIKYASSTDQCSDTYLKRE